MAKASCEPDPRNWSDITPSFREYRDLTRFVWNQHMIDDPDADVEFPELDRILFRALVEARLMSHGLPKERGGERGLAFFPDLMVVSEAAKPSVLAGRAEHGMTKWSPVEARLDEVELRYIGLFDFASVGGCYRDFEFIECFVCASRDADVLVGTHLMLRAMQARLYANRRVIE